MLGKTTYYITFIFIILILIPVIIIKGFYGPEKKEDLILKVYSHQEEKIKNMELENYLRGVVAAEMPALYHLEALKAQAVAARTYTLKQLPRFGGEGCPEYPGADISTDPSIDQAWLGEEELRDKWGFFHFFYYWSKVSRAIAETKGEVLLYNGKLIDAVYHANSGGRTEDSRYVWGRAKPYLRSVKSPYDQQKEKNYLSNFYFSLNELAEKLSLPAEDMARKISIEEKTSSGRVLTLRIGDKIISGSELRGKLGLPSTKFNIEQEAGIITVTVYGSGHGVGLSQDGAHGFAEEGYNYRQILAHYFPGTTIGKIEDIQK